MWQNVFRQTNGHIRNHYCMPTYIRWLAIEYLILLLRWIHSPNCVLRKVNMASLPFVSTGGALGFADCTQPSPKFLGQTFLCTWLLNVLSMQPMCKCEIYNVGRYLESSSGLPYCGNKTASVEPLIHPENENRQPCSRFMLYSSKHTQHCKHTDTFSFHCFSLRLFAFLYRSAI